MPPIQDQAPLEGKSQTLKLNYLGKELWMQHFETKKREVIYMLKIGILCALEIFIISLLKDLHVK